MFEMLSGATGHWCHEIIPLIVLDTAESFAHSNTSLKILRVLQKLLCPEGFIKREG